MTSSGESIPSILSRCLRRGLPVSPLPPRPSRDVKIPYAPVRTPKLTEQEFQLAIKNALRYIPAEYHAELAPEFASELIEEGHIYMRRFRPVEYEMKAYPVDYYPGKSLQARCLMLMIMNNLDPAVAQFPHCLITYGGNGSVLSNWAQYHLLMKFLTQMDDSQTLSMYSGHPAGLFPSHSDAPRVVFTNGLTVPNYSLPSDYDRYYALGISQYGQMTAGSMCYIGPQGIVHGTTLTLINAGRKYLQCDGAEAMRGRVYVSSGLGGMSGAQGKAGIITGCITVLAEIDDKALKKRLSQGWINEEISDLDVLVRRIKEARRLGQVTAIGFSGNIVDVWEKLADEEEMLVDLGSDQTSLHNPFNGGYYPAGLSFSDAQALMASEPEKFRALVNSSLIRHVNAVNRLVKRGMRFWDYGNSFLLQASRAGASVWRGDDQSSAEFKYPTYIQEFVGDIFSLGFGPFRWICCSGLDSDLKKTDEIAAESLRQLRAEGPAAPVDQQLKDNLYWIERAGENKMVVGSQARILYADARGRAAIALALNAAIADGRLSGPVVLSRDHHDVSGTDSPYRESSNIEDGSKWLADMATQNCIGDAMRGATWVALHNGGGCGWGEVINGGFGLVLDGSADAARRADLMLSWDVLNGVARRSWAGNDNARLAVESSMARNENLRVTLPVPTSEEILSQVWEKFGPAASRILVKKQ